MNRAIAELREWYAAGGIELDEFEQRVDDVLHGRWTNVRPVRSPPPRSSPPEAAGLAHVTQVALEREPKRKAPEKAAAPAKASEKAAAPAPVVEEPGSPGWGEKVASLVVVLALVFWFGLAPHIQKGASWPAPRGSGECRSMLNGDTWWRNPQGGQGMGRWGGDWIKLEGHDNVNGIWC